MSSKMVEFQNVTKVYSKYVGLQRFKNTIDRIKNGQIGKKLVVEPDHVALKNVSFSINRGDRLGIIGHNGAGKSTTLKLISGLTSPTSGNIIVNGEVGGVLDLGAGFHPDLTARDNIYLQCALYGKSKSESERLIPEIMKISELENFLDVQLKKFSSGMKVRLGFALAMTTVPDIVLLDEVLSVGDERFRNKSLELMNQFLEGRTLLFVSHSLKQIQKVCDRAIVIERGEMQFDGDPEEAIEIYHKLVDSNAEDGPTQKVIAKNIKRGFAEAPPVTIHKMELKQDGTSIKNGLIDKQKPIEVQVIPHFDTDQRQDINVVISFKRAIVNNLTESLTKFKFSIKTSEPLGEDRISVNCDISKLLPGNYAIEAKLNLKEKNIKVADVIQSIPIRIAGDLPKGVSGLIDLDFTKPQRF